MLGSRGSVLMLRNLYRTQRRTWLRSWSVLDDRVDRSVKCEEQQLNENRIEITASGSEIGEWIKTNHGSHSCTQNVNGIRFEYFQINFWEFLGISAAIVTGIKHSIEYGKLKKLKRQKPEECSSFGKCVILNPLTRVSNLISESGAFDILFSPKSFDLHFLHKLYLQNHLKFSILPTTKEVSRTSISFSKESISSVESESPIADTNIKEEVSQTKVRESSLSPYSFHHSESLFLRTSNIIEPLSSLLALKHVPQNPKCSEINSKSTLLSWQLQNLVDFLNEATEELLVEEKCNMAAELAKKGDFEVAIKIWYEIIKKHPFHGKSLYNLGMCFENGLGVSRNVNKAKELYNKATKMNHPRSYYRLARIHRHEWKQGSQASLELYEKYLKESANFGFVRAEQELQKLLSINKLCNESLSTKIPRKSKFFHGYNLDLSGHSINKSSPKDGVSSQRFPQDFGYGWVTHSTPTPSLNSISCFN